MDKKKRGGRARRSETFLSFFSCKIKFLITLENCLKAEISSIAPEFYTYTVLYKLLVFHIQKPGCLGILVVNYILRKALPLPGNACEMSVFLIPCQNAKLFLFSDLESDGCHRTIGTCQKAFFIQLVRK